MITKGKRKKEKGKRNAGGVVLSPCTFHLFPYRGSMLLQMVVYTSLAVAFLVGIIAWLGASMRAARTVADRELSFQIAEAGIDYYRWHLAHARSDFTDGTNLPSPYIHRFKNAHGVEVGQFSLDIKAPEAGQTLVTVTSRGTVDNNPLIYREIEAKFGIPSYSKYAVLANDTMRFGSATTIEGLVHSNDGVRFDGVAKNMVTSAKDSYSDPDHSGGKEYAVHTHAAPTDPLPVTPLPLRPDVFMAGREVAIPAVDFGSITNDLSDIKAAAEADGKYLTASGAMGYHITLKTDKTFTLSKVTSLRTLATRVGTGCYTTENPLTPGWGSWTITTEQYVGDYPFPANGVIFVEDHLWIDGKINNAKLTVATGHFPQAPGQDRDMIVNNNLTYTNYDGRDVLGLIAQGNFTVGLESADVLRIDGAIIAQGGKAGRYYYMPPDAKARCSPYHVRSSLTLYGSLATNKRYGFAWTDGTGYSSVNIIYDGNLLYGAPPLFPLSADQYETVSWEETTFSD